MTKKELEDKISECVYRISSLEKKLLQSEERIELLKGELEKRNIEDLYNYVDIQKKNLSDDLYEFVLAQKREIFEQVYDNIDDKNKMTYDYVNTQSNRCMKEIDLFKQEQANERWMRTYGYDNLISELQLCIIENEFKGNRKKLESLKNTHLGEKCFIIGNGPSLRAEDLTKIKQAGIFSFASKGIYNIFEETEWRPDVWGVSDLNYIEMKKDDINKLKGFVKLVCAQSYIKKGIKLDDDVIYYPFIQNKRNPYVMYDDVTRGVQFYGTFTGKLINFACYMGFKEIYWLGCDHTIPTKKNSDGSFAVDTSVNAHFSNAYSSVEENTYLYRNMGDPYKVIEDMNVAFRDIKYICESEGIKVLNATRGGALEVFERIAFESIV